MDTPFKPIKSQTQVDAYIKVSLSKDKTVPVSTCPGLFLRGQSSKREGGPTSWGWLWVYFHEGRQKRMTVPRLSSKILSLNDAVQTVRALTVEYLDVGLCPREEPLRQKAEAEAALAAARLEEQALAQFTVTKLVDAYLDQLTARGKKISEAKRVLARIPAGDLVRPAKSINKSDVIAWIQSVPKINLGKEGRCGPTRTQCSGPQL